MGQHPGERERAGARAVRRCRDGLFHVRVSLRGVLLRRRGRRGVTGGVCEGVLPLLRETALVLGLKGFVAQGLVYNWRKVECMGKVTCSSSAGTKGKVKQRDALP